MICEFSLRCTHMARQSRTYSSIKQYLSIMGAVLNEVLRPDMALMLRSERDAGEEIAIIKKEGRWFQVVYRDPLANQLPQGCVYGTLVLHLNEGESKRYVSEATVMLAGQPFLYKA